MKIAPLKDKLTISISKNHYSGYTNTTVETVEDLIEFLATHCVSPVDNFKDEERMGYNDKLYLSKGHRANRNIVSRGLLGMIDFEGDYKQFKKLLKKLRKMGLWFIAIPSQSNLSQVRTARFHIVYLLTKPYAINKDAFKEQSKAFFRDIGYKWDTDDSGIDITATFNACGYFSPTIQLPGDAKTKELPDPYLDLDMVKKDIKMNVGKNTKAYKPIKASSNETNTGASKIAKGSKSIKSSDFNSGLLQANQYSCLVKPILQVPVADGGFITMAEIKEELLSMEGESPTISGLGCPECSDIHSDDPLTTRYAFAGIDDHGKVFVYCGGSHKMRYHIAEHAITIWRIVKTSTGTPLYIILDKDMQVIYTDKSVGSVLFSYESCADELNSEFGMGLKDEYGVYSRGMTAKIHVAPANSLALIYNPFLKSGFNARERYYNLVEEPSYTPKPEEPNKIVALALGGFSNDVKWRDYPLGIIYLAYYLFHTRKIMAILFLVHARRKIGKSTWVLDIPKWYLGRSWGMMDNQAIDNAWDDAKLGVRGLCYEDIENLNAKVKSRLAADLKSDATGGEYKLLNIKGQAQVRSFGHNSVGTTNHRNQIPLDGQHDRRIHVVEFNPVEDERLLGAFDKEKSGEINLKNAVNFLYKVYLDCEKNIDDDLYNYLYTQVPSTEVKSETASGNLRTGEQIGKLLLNTKTLKELKENLGPLVSISKESACWNGLDSWIKKLDLKSKGDLDITDKQLLELYQMTPNGGQEGKEYTSMDLIRILGLQDTYPSGFRQLKIKGEKRKGIKLPGYSQ